VKSDTGSKPVDICDRHNGCGLYMLPMIVPAFLLDLNSFVLLLLELLLHYCVTPRRLTLIDGLTGLLPYPSITMRDFLRA
jgi:hypothetical protein